MTITDKSGNRKEGFRSALESSKVLSLGDEVRIASFQDEMRAIDRERIDSMKFDGQLTDISRAIRWTAEQSENANLRAGLMITDGAFNAGSNPLYDAELLGKPLYIIGIGDSTEPKDIAIQTIITNDLTYLESSVPINVNIKSNGFSDDAATATKLILSDNGAPIAEQSIGTPQ